MPLAEAVEFDHHDAERLRRQAHTLRARADALADERADVLAEARALEAEAAIIDDRLTRRPVTVRRTPAEADADDCAKVCDLLGATGPLSSSDVADHFGWSATRARAILARAEQTGVVKRTGVKRGTRYQLADDAPTEPTNVRVFGNYQVLVRDAAIKLGTFDIVSLALELPHVSEGTLRRWVNRLEERGLFESAFVDGRKVWAYVEPEAAKVERRKQATPEQVAMRDASVKVPERGTAVAGAGRVASGSPVVNELLREVKRVAPGVEVVKRTHKYAFMLGGKEIASCSTTPGASRLGGTRKQLRDNGVMVAA